MITLTTTDTLNTKSENRSFDIYNYGDDNLYPNHNKTLANNSTSLRRCTKTFIDFVYGSGLVEEKAIWMSKINARGLKVDQFLRRLIEDYAIHSGFAFKVQYTGDLKIASLTPIPFETVRLKKEDDFGIIKKVRVYKDWSASRIEKNLIKDYDIYNPNQDVLVKQIELAGGYEKYQGQIYYYGHNGEVSYPYAKFHSAIEDVVTDIKLKNGRNSNASTNFMASHFLKMPWDWYELAQNYIAANPDQKQTVQQVADNLKEEWVASLQDFQGLDKLGKIAILTSFKQDSDGKIIYPELDKIDLQNYDKMYELTATQVKENIRGVYQIPPILLDPVSTGFSTEIMQAAYNYYNNITNNSRQVFEQVMNETFPLFQKDFKLESYDIVPMPYIQTDEGGKALASELGVGGTAAMQAILTDTILTTNQKLGTLQVLFGLSEERAKLILDIE